MVEQATLEDKVRRARTSHVLSSDLMCGMVVTGRSSLWPKLFNGANKLMRVRDGSAREEEGLTDGKSVSFSTNQLVWLSRDSQVLPYVCRDNRLTDHQSQKETG